MNETVRVKLLTVALRAVAAIFIFGLYPLTVVWPSGWCWHPGQSEYLQMIIGIYATLGIFLAIASAHPERHQSLISFTIWSSIVHAAIMAAQAIRSPVYMGHLYGDVPALAIVAVVLGWLSPRALAFKFTAEAT
jgi:hypothetical protein